MKNVWTLFLFYLFFRDRRFFDDDDGSFHIVKLECAYSMETSACRITSSEKFIRMLPTERLNIDRQK